MHVRACGTALIETNHTKLVAVSPVPSHSTLFGSSHAHSKQIEYCFVFQDKERFTSWFFLISFFSWVHCTGKSSAEQPEGYQHWAFLPVAASWHPLGLPLLKGVSYCAPTRRINGWSIEVRHLAQGGDTEYPVRAWGCGAVIERLVIHMNACPVHFSQYCPSAMGKSKPSVFCQTCNWITAPRQ